MAKREPVIGGWDAGLGQGFHGPTHAGDASPVCHKCVAKYVKPF